MKPETLAKGQQLQAAIFARKEQLAQLLKTNSAVFLNKGVSKMGVAWDCTEYNQGKPDSYVRDSATDGIDNPLEQIMVACKVDLILTLEDMIAHLQDRFERLTDDNWDTI